MNFSAAIISLCALVALAHSRHLGDTARNRPLNTTLQLMHQDIRATLTKIDAQRAMLPNSLCESLNMKELELAKQNFTAANLARFRCHMMTLSALTPDLLSGLQNIIQYSKDVEQQLSSQAVEQDYTCPMLEDGETYIYMECLLKLLVELLTKAKF